MPPRGLSAKHGANRARAPLQAPSRSPSGSLERASPRSPFARGLPSVGRAALDTSMATHRAWCSRCYPSPDADAAPRRCSGVLLTSQERAASMSLTAAWMGRYQHMPPRLHAGLIPSGVCSRGHHRPPKKSPHCRRKNQFLSNFGVRFLGPDSGPKKRTPQDKNCVRGPLLGGRNPAPKNGPQT